MTTRTQDQPRRRRHAIIAILAGLAGIALLTSAGGTFANWYQNQDLTTGSVTAGQLDLTQPTAGTWTVAHVQSTTEGDYGAEQAIADITQFTMVPGDRLTYNATADVVLQGNNLKANLVADTSTITAGGLKDYLKTGDPTVTMTDSADVAITNPLTGNADGTVKTISGIKVKVVMEFPYNTTTPNGNEGETLTLDLSQIKLSLTQIP